MNRYICVSVAALMLASCSAPESMKVYVDAPGMVELDADSVLAGLHAQYVVVTDAAGDTLASQVTSDGKFIFMPTEINAEYMLSGSDRAVAYDTIAYGRIYPERLDDVCWENDKVGFRAYGPGTQRAGDRLYGYDLFLKRDTVYPIIPYMIANDHDPAKWLVVDSLRNAGLASAADSLINTFSYHVDHGYGMDCYAVGPTLGACTSAIAPADTIAYPWCYSQAEILDNGPLRFTARLTFPPMVIGTDTIIEERLISLDAGSNLNKTEVVFRGATRPYPVVTGIVLHDAGESAYHSVAESCILYLDPTQGYDNGEVYIGATFPQKPDSTAIRHGHVLAYGTIAPGGTYTYYWGFGWNRGNMPDLTAWKNYLIKTQKH